MPKVSQISAQLLRRGRQTIAGRMCGRLEELPTSSATEVSSNLRTEQFATHLHVLAACIEFASPLLLEDYVVWITNLPESVSPYDYDISRFLRDLQRFVEVEFPRDASGVVRNYIDRALVAVEKAAPPEPGARPQNPVGDLQRQYLEMLLAKRRDDAMRVVLDAIEEGIGIESIYLNVIQPSQQEVGQLWQSGKIDVAQEHYCTAATQFIMSQLQPYFMTASSTGKTLVASCVGDELHEVGLRIVADLFEINGWNTIYLGANAPADSIAGTIVSTGAQVLAISTTMAQHLYGVAEVIRAVRSTGGCEHVKVLVGGYPFNVDPFLWKRVGADADAVDGQDAVDVAERLITLDDRQHAAVESLEPAADTESDPPLLGESEDDLSRLNNNLVTLHRKLNKANVELAASDKANQEKAAALERADRRKDEFLAMLAHELRGPLAPLEMAVTLLQMDDVKPAVVQEARAAMKRQLQQLKRLISDLLDASRIANGKIELKLEKLNLQDIIHRAVEIVHPLMLEKKQKLTLNLSEPPAIIQGDEIRLAQVFANLLTNAAKYSNQKSEIRLTTRHARDKVVVEVSDDGIGIEAELLPDIFSAFAQEQRSRQQSMGGLGLGLSIVKQIVELHEGTVAAESAGADKGSVFTVYLPSMEPEQIPGDVEFAAQQTGEAQAPSRSVLVVEDTAGIAKITALLFEKLGHTASVALDGATAIQKYKQLRPEIVVLDLMLPDMNGLDVAREISQSDSAGNTVIVALTGHDDERHRRLARENGCDEYLVKPVDVRDLAQLGAHPKLQGTPGLS